MARAQTAAANRPADEDFAALLDETLGQGPSLEGSVVKGTVVAIENDVAVIDVGLKCEGRVALKEFSGPGRAAEIKVGDIVEVYLERVENALGEAVLSRDKARREEAWEKLEQSFGKNVRVEGVIFGRVKGGFTVDLSGAVAFLPGSQVDIRPVRDVQPLVPPTGASVAMAAVALSDDAPLASSGFRSNAAAVGLIEISNESFTVSAPFGIAPLTGSTLATVTVAS